MSLTDFWGLVIEYFLNQTVREQEVTTFSLPQLPFYTFLLPTLILLLGSEWFLPAWEAECHTHSLAKAALTPLMPPGSCSYNCRQKAQGG